MQVIIRATKDFIIGFPRETVVSKGSEKKVNKADWDKNRFWTETDNGNCFGSCNKEGWELVRILKK